MSQCIRYYQDMAWLTEMWFEQLMLIRGIGLVKTNIIMGEWETKREWLGETVGMTFGEGVERLSRLTGIGVQTATRIEQLREPVFDYCTIFGLK